MTWEEQDKAWRVLRVLKANDGLPPRLVVKDPLADVEGAALFSLEDADLPGLCVALHEACGQPVPVITPRPDVDTSAAMPFHSLALAVMPGAVRLIHSPGGRVIDDLPPSEARRLAGLLVAYADAADAEPEPDPAEVEALALLIESGRDAAKAHEHGGLTVYADSLARHLLSSGRVTVTGKDGGNG